MALAKAMLQRDAPPLETVAAAVGALTQGAGAQARASTTAEAALIESKYVLKRCGSAAS
jgi:hypothetical protein